MQNFRSTGLFSISKMYGCWAGVFLQKQLKQVQAWALLHQRELMENFINLGKEFKSYNKIDPLQ